DVIDRRADDFHEVVTIIEPLSLHDILHLRETAGEIKVYTDHPGIPDGPDNIVYQAAQLIREESGIKRGVVIRIEKMVPAAAGLGGGSANAARTLLRLNELWELNLSPQTMVRLGGQLGSDVPFFLNPTTSLCRGRGEEITPLPPPPGFWAVLIKPSFPISTHWAYEELAISGSRPPHRKLKVIIEALNSSDLSGLGSSLYNIFQEVLEPKIPRLHEILNFFRNNNTLGTILSGSGSTVVGLVATEPEAQALADRARSEFPSDYLFRIATNSI
ncbi:MAG TPA: 4-(cytidine 5'-diphospho)-2-C-methyl-D-erythritol kinase, partial [Proteobacteria bacterium]|nr:4-(cytidine 5'-diphospho)-2-C-methyl-D-erythritol kinase [Pseudomonadota bacterium]